MTSCVKEAFNLLLSSEPVLRSKVPFVICKPFRKFLGIDCTALLVYLSSSLLEWLFCCRFDLESMAEKVFENMHRGCIHSLNITHAVCLCIFVWCQWRADTVGMVCYPWGSLERSELLKTECVLTAVVVLFMQCRQRVLSSRTSFKEPY